MPVRQVGRYPPPLCSYNKSFFNKERLIDFFEGTLVLAYGRRDCVCSYWPSLEGIDYCTEYPVVNGIEAASVDFKLVKSVFCYFQINLSVPHHLCKVSNPAQERIGNARSTAAAHGNLPCSLIFNCHVEYACTAPYYLHQVIHIVVLQSTGNSESGTKRSCQKTASGSGSDQGERV